MKKILIFLSIVVIAFICIAFFQNMVIKSIVTNTATSIIGAPVQMDSFSINLFSSSIRITGLKMFNPSGFPEGLLVSCPKINVIYDLNSLLKQKPHFILVEVDLMEMVLTKNKEGKLSVDSLKIVHPPKSSAPVPMKIDILNLTIGKIVYKDYTVGTEPGVRVYDIDRHKSYKSVPTAQQLALLVLSEPMKAAAIKNAEIYGVAALTGVAMLPVAVVATFTSKDNVEQTIDASFDHTYAISLQVLKRMGNITQNDAVHGVIKANINGSMIALILRKSQGNRTAITISARKFMLPELDIAGGVMYQILNKM